MYRARMVHPAPSQVVKPNELLSALARPAYRAHYEPDRDAAFLAATLAYGLILGHPFLDGNKRIGDFLCSQPMPQLRGLTETDYETELLAMADRHTAVACGSRVVSSPEGLLSLGK
ncbi:hypothetical protein B0H17DRAFT_1013085 [Mycena rosella]|uniref:Fido domain-containing protein n=1 Tax=Mycena rosella TaxID=1033263 RepID=A0AAD7DB24_MYCRO|nr:hypothetical protein B0H17DRAFT_1013085 [Mycena rosella]